MKTFQQFMGESEEADDKRDLAVDAAETRKSDRLKRKAKEEENKEDQARNAATNARIDNLENQIAALKQS
tara:strand:- start:368 stop:577 length:210 start_codon:yes stop_codon:yes gene_type:complete